MTQENQDVKAGASSGDVQAPPITPAPTPTPPKVETKDGHILVDGRKMVAESDLIATKKSLESAAEKAQAAHNEAIDAAKLELSAAQQSVADLNAKLTADAQARQSGATTDEEVARIKQERDDALKQVGTLTASAAKALELRRELLVTRYSIPADSLANKTMQELDSFEEAAKALSTSRGGSPGPYALGGGLGGAAPMTPRERAAKVIASTPVRGVRAAESEK